MYALDRMNSITDLLGGIMRYLPNTLTASLLVLGITLGKIAWILIAVCAIALTILVLALQYVLSKFSTFGIEESTAILYTCSILPIKNGSESTNMFSTIPSVWLTLAAFYMTYILTNAVNIYTAKPTKLANEAIAVQQRKGIGIISIIATSVLFLFFIVPRFMSACEGTYKVGALIGIALGSLFGWASWKFLHACNSNLYPDIHGVMIGLRPGDLHTTPRACTPSSS
jgi:hypothetical protein